MNSFKGFQCNKVSKILINRILHWSLMQTEKSQPEGKRIMPKKEVDRVYGIIPWSKDRDFSACIGHRCLIIFLTYDIKNVLFIISFIFDILCPIMTFSEHHSMFFVVLHKWHHLWNFVFGVIFNVTRELSQPISKTEFSSTTKNRTNSIS